ncbi:ABC transporter ATP-binding protein [Actinophytocola oryzae]|uniref:ATP-binding cassette subfamily B protein n=1 Tax=Actinophytocola oryzae TaxID=502181 RepID=A0A4R7W072_9PSEU|nr:ABC transporter ATP-binding protein [Actinophytocola oryzae]TDV55219.1 ATP-binding cassette subfamily B protein [Actinophytocola oryzae]
MTAFAQTARRSAGWLPVIGVSALLGTLGALALPVVLGRAVDSIVGGGSPVWFWLATGLVVLGIAVDLVDAYAGTACVAGTTAWLRDRVVRHVLSVGPRNGFETGDLVSRVSGNAAEAANAGPVVVTVWMALLPPVGSLVMLVYLDFWLAVAFLAGVALVAVVLRLFTLRTAAVVSAYLTVQGRLAARFSESLTGVRTIASAGTVAQEERRVLSSLPALHDEGMRTWRVLSSSAAQGAVVGPLVLVAVLATGGWGLAAGRLTPGELFAAGQYAMLGAGLGGLTGVFGRLARARAGAERVGEVLAGTPVSYGTAVLPADAGSLEFRGVSVDALLTGVSFVVPGGAVAAVVGRSGAGKSVLASVAARLRDPSAGEVLLAGVPLTSLSHEELRAAVGCAFERPNLVGATVGAAIGPGGEQAARATYAHEFVSRLPEGYATPLVDAPMSGGELQRLGLARSWQATRLLVLDDATSSVDMVTEMRIGTALARTGGRTRLVVTHRLSTAAQADLVVWLEDGRLRAVGTHEELWTREDYREVFG